MFKIGIDIGGTNTDAVVIDSQANIIAATKQTTTGDIVTGVKKALEVILASVSRDGISEIVIGTTHATNAILEAKNLYRVGVLRLAGHRPQTLPSCLGWPAHLREKVFVDCATVGGGFECHGDVISPMSIVEIRDGVDRLLDMGAESLAVVGTFSPLNPEQELLVEEIVAGKVPTTLSHRLGGIGFIERENAAILNAALMKALKQGFGDLTSLLAEMGLGIPLWVTQNNGSQISLDEALQFPVLTISAGPTNSFAGATKLTGVQDAIIVDVGGTSTDIGVVRRGYARRSRGNAIIGGVKLNFAVPDVLSIPLGGGSIIKVNGGTAEIGPGSVARRLLAEAYAFGGNTLTLTDIGLRAGILFILGTEIEHVPLGESQCQEVMQTAFDNVKAIISRVSAGEPELPVIFIGGGAVLFSDRSQIQIPDRADVANAFGAALAEVSGRVDRVVSLKNREGILQKIRDEALKKAITAGADAKSVAIVEQEIIPYHYIPGEMARVIMTASGTKSDLGGSGRGCFPSAGP